MKKSSKTLKNSEKAITLIALVITIIVLLILAGISISMLSGDNSILSRATNAKTKSDEAQIKERIQLAYHSALTGGQGNYTKDSLMEELENEFKTDYDVDDSNDENWIMKAQGQEVTIPAGEKTIKTAILQGKEFWQGGNLYNLDGLAYVNITKIIRYTSKPNSENMTDEHLWSISASENPVYFWLDNNILYYWSEANHIYLGNDCSFMFNRWSSLTDISGLNNVDTSNVTNMASMFNGCSSLTNVSAIENWDTSNVTDMNLMFNEAKFTNLDLSNWNVSKVTDMSKMFVKCSELTTLNISNWNTSNVNTMQEMFAPCEKLTTIYSNGEFTMKSGANSSAMFGGCSLLVGGNGTEYNVSNIDATYAHIDGGTSNPGYFTAK